MLGETRRNYSSFSNKTIKVRGQWGGGVICLAFIPLLLNSQGTLCRQQNKYHFPKKWSMTMIVTYLKGLEVGQELDFLGVD